MSYRDFVIDELNKLKAEGIPCWVSDESIEHAIHQEDLRIIKDYDSDSEWFEDTDYFSWRHAVPVNITLAKLPKEFL